MKYYSKKLNHRGVSSGGIAIFVGLAVIIAVTVILFGFILVKFPVVSASINFDSSGYDINSAGKIIVKDSSANQDSTKKETISVHVTSDADTIGFDVTLVEDDINSGIFVNEKYIRFTSLGTDLDVGALEVSAGDTVRATYNMGGESTSTTTSIHTDIGTFPTIGTPLVIQPAIDCGPNDSDGDFLCDDWENPDDGLFIPYGSTTFYHPCDPSCPRSDTPDVYVEVDWMTGHEPDPAAINRVIDAFAAQGITLHVQRDEDIRFHRDQIPLAGDPANQDFDHIKLAHFGTPDERNSADVNDYLNAKRQAFHYALFIHSQAGNPGSSGWAEIPGNDFVVSLGSFTGNVGSQDQQEGTFMHELGHNLGLAHGGRFPGAGATQEQINSIQDNCKPNYLSVMSYSRQFSEYIAGRLLDYSRSALPSLNENAGLSEPAGVGSSTPAGQQTVYGPSPVQISQTGIPVNWDRIGGATDTGVTANINNLGISGCRDDDYPGVIALKTLNGAADWSNLQYDFRTVSTFADGIHTDPDALPEITLDIVIEIRSSRINALDDAIQNLPDDVFAGNAISAKKTLHNDLLVVDDLIKEDKLDDAIAQLLDIRTKMDGYDDGNPDDDLIIDPVAQKLIREMLDSIVDSFEIAAQPAATKHEYTQKEQHQSKNFQQAQQKK